MVRILRRAPVGKTIILVLVLFLASVIVTPENSTSASAGRQSSAIMGPELQSAFLQHNKNLSTSGTPPGGSLPVLSFYNSTSDSLQSITGIGASHQPSAKPDFIAELSGQPYVGIVGYTSQGSRSSIYSVTTTIQLVGSSSYLGSNTVSAGLNVHVYDTNYDVDYLLQFYAYFSSNGYANVAYAIYSACAGPGYSCGPAYGNCSILNCSTAYITIASGLVTDIGKAGGSYQSADILEQSVRLHL